MGIFLNPTTKVIVYDIASDIAQHHANLMLSYGTKIVAGVSISELNKNICNIPTYRTILEAGMMEKPDAIVLFVRPQDMKLAALEAINAGIQLLVMLTEHVPIHDTMEIIASASARGIDIIGPNTSGLISPSVACKVGFVPSQYFIPGKVGVLARSSSLAYEIVSRLTIANIGQSLCVNVGGDAIVGTTFSKMALLFEADPETEVILVIGEVGGVMEENLAELVQKGEITKPVIAYIAGHWAPEGKRMGHAGAIASTGQGGIKSKLKSLEMASIPVANVPGDVVYLVQEAMSKVRNNQKLG